MAWRLVVQQSSLSLFILVILPTVIFGLLPPVQFFQPKTNSTSSIANPIADFAASSMSQVTDIQQKATKTFSKNSGDPLAASSMSQVTDIQQKATKTFTKTSGDPLPRPPDFVNVNEPSVIILKRKKGQVKDYNKLKVKQKLDDIAQEMECTQTMYMSPYHHDVHFSLNSSIYSRYEKICKWKFIGSEPCTPMITCDTSNLTKDCDKEYLEVVDGAQGYMKVCGVGESSRQKVVNMSATDQLRDLYVHFKVFKSNKTKNIKNIFSCTVQCSKKLQGSPLEKRFLAKSNPKCFCGTRPNEDKIVGGDAAKKFEYPWLVALVETNTRQPFCGGSIVNNRFILTAAHCFQGRFMDYRNVQVVVNGHEFDQSPNLAGENQPAPLPKTYPFSQLEKMDRMNNSKRYNLEEIIIHPLYVMETNDFDIALLKLQEDIDLTPKPQSLMKPETMDIYLQQPRAICLPELGSYARTYSNKKATVAGWGLPSMDARGTMRGLQKLDVKVFSPQVCKELYAHRVNRRMMCAGHREGGKDSCSGDSGGPLIAEEKRNVWTQVGAVSWGDGCGLKDNPGVYFRITEVVQWIHYNSNYAGAREDDEDASATWCMTPP